MSSGNLEAMASCVGKAPSCATENWLLQAAVLWAWQEAGRSGDLAALLDLLGDCEGQATAAVWIDEALMQASAHGHASCVEALAPRAGKEALNLAACCAAELGKADCIQALGLNRLDASFVFGSKSRDAMSYACLGDNAACAKHLAPVFGCGAKDEAGRNGLMVAAERCGEEFLKELLPYHDGSRGGCGMDLLMAAACSGKSGKVRLALAVCDPAAVNSIGLSALMFSTSSHWGCADCGAGALDSLRLLASARGVDLAALDQGGDDAMSHAAASLSLEKIKVLEQRNPGWMRSCAASKAHAWSVARYAIDMKKEKGEPLTQSQIDCEQYLARDMHAQEESRQLAEALDKGEQSRRPVGTKGGMRL